MINRVYSYIGASDLNDPKLFQTERTLVATGGEFLATLQYWQRQKRYAPAIFTFIVDTDGLLWIADRQSEHIACARGGDFLSAGEITFETEDDHIIVSGVTNQSTGYCPEPESWPAVATALDGAHLSHLGHFTQEFICGVCGKELEQEWNF